MYFHLLMEVHCFQIYPTANHKLENKNTDMDYCHPFVKLTKQQRNLTISKITLKH